MTVVASTPAQIQMFRAIVIARAVSFYLRTGMKVNRAYTPTAMCAAVAQIVGRETPYRRGKNGMRDALADLEAWKVRAEIAEIVTAVNDATARA